MRNPGCFGDWRNLLSAERGEIGMDWPYTFKGTQASISAVTAAALVASVPNAEPLDNKWWLCIENGRVFLYTHDCDVRLITLEEE